MITARHIPLSHLRDFKLSILAGIICCFMLVAPGTANEIQTVDLVLVDRLHVIRPPALKAEFRSLAWNLHI